MTQFADQNRTGVMLLHDRHDFSDGCLRSHGRRPPGHQVSDRFHRLAAQIHKPVQAPTKKPPPMIFPRVTGNRLLSRNDPVLRLSIFKLPLASTSACCRRAGSFLTASPAGMKYILAIQCSKPRATNAVIGKRIASILSVTERPLKHSQTARQTS